MGQATSRQAARHVQKLARTRGAAPFTTKAPKPPGVALGRPEADSVEPTEDADLAIQQRHQREEQEEKQLQIKQQQQSIQEQQPQPDLNTGFYRGTVSDPRDVAQENFLVHQRGGNTEYPELAPDLLQFLKDTGPLQKKVNKEFTSKRILQEMENENDATEQENLHRLEAARRERRDMRLVEGIDGFSTPRTTNFFTQEDDEDVKDFGLHDLEMYDFLKQQEQAATNEDNADNKSMVESFYQKHIDHRMAEAGWTEEEQAMHQKWLKDTAQYLQLPVVIKDEEDGTYMGLWPKDLETEFASRRKVDVVSENRVKLVLADLFDMQRKEVRKIK